MKGSIHGKYPKTFNKKNDDGTKTPTRGFMYVYELTGSSEEIAKYVAFQQSEGRDAVMSDNDKPLFFSPNTNVGVSAPVQYTQAGKPFLVDDDLPELEAELANATTLELRQAYASEIISLCRERKADCKKALAKVKGGASATVAEVIAEEVEEEAAL